MSDLAIRLNMSRAGVYRWKENGKIPADRVAEVSAATKIPREYLRPDLYSSELEQDLLNGLVPYIEGLIKENGWGARPARSVPYGGNGR